MGESYCCVYDIFVFCTHVQEDFEDTKGVIKIHKSQMYRQHNDYKEKDKRTNNDVQNTTQKTKDTNHSKQSKSKKSKHSRAPGVTSAVLVGSVMVTFSLFCAMLCFSLVFIFFPFVFFVFVLRLVCLILAVSLDYRFLIDPSVFANV